jgi:hypothetical protein
LQARLDTTVAAFISGDMSALAKSVADQLPPVPDGAKTNLQTAARTNQDCQDAGIFG